MGFLQERALFLDFVDLDAVEFGLGLGSLLQNADELVEDLCVFATAPNNLLALLELAVLHFIQWCFQQVG